MWRRANVPANDRKFETRIAPFLNHRGQFPLLLNALGLMGEGAEIGVQCGVFSEVLLRNWRGKRLYCIDPWQAFPQDDYRDVANVPQSLHDQYFARTQASLKPFGRRVRILRQLSHAAAPHFADGQLDFVYLDAQHHYEAVRADLLTWAPKVRPGGLLAGHDYLDGENAAGVFGVKSAVDEFRIFIFFSLISFTVPISINGILLYLMICVIGPYGSFVKPNLLKSPFINRNKG